VTSDGPRLAHLLLLLPLLGAVFWVAARGRTASGDPSAVLHELRRAQGPTLPEAARAGASARTDVERYDRDNLYAFIDGAADAYLARGFQRCVVATYSFTGTTAGGIEIDAEAYRFASRAGARAQLAAERPTAAQPVPAIPGAVADDSVLVMQSSDELLKLTVVTAGGAAHDDLVRLAAAWREVRP
jgi:Family of unknown function (DUF6599)